MNKLAPVLILIILLPGAAGIPVMQSDIPVHADAGLPIHIFVNITSEEPVSHVQIYYVNPRDNIDYYDEMNMSSGNSTNGTWTFVIPPQGYEGTLDVRVFARDAGGNYSYVPSKTGYVTVSLDGPGPAKQFPWNIVFLVGFMAIVLVATELVFKPGFYRKTGRQRARELEEEDRKKDMENNSGP